MVNEALMFRLDLLENAFIIHEIPPKSWYDLIINPIENNLITFVCP